jgi:hypothetical protein
MSKQKDITSVRKLAAAVGRSPAAIVRHWLRNPEWRWSRRAPWRAADVAAMRQWAVDTLRQSDATGGDVASNWDDEIAAEVRRLREMADAWERESKG